MAALNDGAVAGNGHLVGVIHEMFLVDNGDHVDGASYMDKKNDDDDIRRDGSAHYAFDVDKATNDSSSSSNPSTQRDGPIREILVAGGDDLQERKRLLVKNADALVVLPGGPGTWDEVSPEDVFQMDQDGCRVSANLILFMLYTLYDFSLISIC